VSLKINSLGIIKASGGVFNRVGEAIDDLLKGHDNVAAQLSTDPNGGDIVPPPISGLQVQHMGNGLINVQITDNAAISRAINYHIEYAPADASGNPNFTSPQGWSPGPWRTDTRILPNGTYYFRGYSQYPAGGPPSSPVLAQGPIQVTGSSSLALLPSQASGTGKPGTGGGHGSGKTITRS
jgi:hypothetical protein